MTSTETAAVQTETTADKLLARWQEFCKSNQFTAGQLVTWKEGLRNKSTPLYGAPAIVVEVLDMAVIDETVDAGSLYFREPLDIILGILDEDNDFILMFADSRRFQPYITSRVVKAEHDYLVR